MVHDIIKKHGEYWKILTEDGKHQVPDKTHITYDDGSTEVVMINRVSENVWETTRPLIMKTIKHRDKNKEM